MKATTWWVTVALFGLLAVGLLPGCEIGNPDTVVALANGSFAGNYVGSSNAALVARNSGSAVTSLVVSQFGNQLEAVDNNGILFKGTIGDILNASAVFTLTGATTAGATVNINGNLRASGSTATMNGVWAESDFYSSIFGTATITPITNAVVTTAVARAGSGL